MPVHGSQTRDSAKAPTAADDAFRLAAESLSKVGEHWSVVPRQTKDVTKFLHDFYASWVSRISVWLILPDACQNYVERMSQMAKAGGLDKAAQTLRAKIEEAAEPYAEIDWLVTFPTVVTGHRRKCLILYMAALCRARAIVIEDCAVKLHVAQRVLDPYDIVKCEIERLHQTGQVSDLESQWMLLRLRRDKVQGDIELDDAIAAEHELMDEP
jgi:hypothetical protein